MACLICSQSPTMQSPSFTVSVAQVCDFNLARALKTDMVEPSATLNSPAWSAPERLQGKRYGKSADVFSFGVILWELITLGKLHTYHERGNCVMLMVALDVARKCLIWPYMKWCRCIGVPWRDMAEDGSVDEGRDNFYYVLNNVIEGNHLPCPLSVEPILPELPEVRDWLVPLQL